MKKLISIAILFVMVAMLATTMVNAATNSTLANDIYAVGSKYGMTSADKVRIERYLADYPVTDEQANKVMAYVTDAENYMIKIGAKNLSEVSAADKEFLKDIANNTATVLGLTLTFKAKTVEIYKNGKLIETVTFNNGKLAYTGNSINLVLVVSSVAVVALATGFVVRKKFANA